MFYFLPFPSYLIIAVSISRLLTRLRLADQTEPIMQPIYADNISLPSHVHGKKISQSNRWISKAAQ
jgi:hypothetical protein